jgi:hypothetical protein
MQIGVAGRTGRPQAGAQVHIPPRGRGLTLDGLESKQQGPLHLRLCVELLEICPSPFPIAVALRRNSIDLCVSCLLVLH